MTIKNTEENKLINSLIIIFLFLSFKFQAQEFKSDVIWRIKQKDNIEIKELPFYKIRFFDSTNCLIEFSPDSTINMNYKIQKGYLILPVINPKCKLFSYKEWGYHLKIHYVDDKTLVFVYRKKIRNNYLQFGIAEW